MEFPKSQDIWIFPGNIPLVNPPLEGGGIGFCRPPDYTDVRIDPPLMGQLNTNMIEKIVSPRASLELNFLLENRVPTSGFDFHLIIIWTK